MSDRAYGCHRSPIGRRRSEDLWDCVLAKCGYTISDFRRRSRRAVYLKHPRRWSEYTRRHFEELWAGCKHLCPYYNDRDDERVVNYDGCIWNESEDGQVEDECEEIGWCRCGEDELNGSECECDTEGYDRDGEILESDDYDPSNSEDGGINIGPFCEAR